MGVTLWDYGWYHLLHEDHTNQLKSQSYIVGAMFLGPFTLRP